MNAESPPTSSAALLPTCLAEEVIAEIDAETLLSSLQIQYDWGVEIAMEDEPWCVLTQQREESPPSRFSPHTLSQQAGQQIRPKIAQKKEKPPSYSEESSHAGILGAGTVEELVIQSKKLEGVTLARTATHHLAPILVKGAPFLLIGEAPDEEEDRTGILFSGPSGRILDRILSSVGLKREQISLAPAIPWRPPGGQPVSEHELTQCLPILQRIIALAAPRYILTMGSTPASLLLGKANRLSQCRGQWQEISVPECEASIPLLPVMHPRQLMGTSRMVPGYRRALWYDVLELAEKLDL